MLGVEDPEVTDVQINGSSIVTNGVANVPYAGSNPGAVKIDNTNGVGITGDGKLYVEYAPESLIKAGTGSYRPICPPRQHMSAFYGLAKAAGDSTQSASSNAVGNYTDAAKIAIQKMLGIYEAPWELIREDEFTNETQATEVVTVDDDGDAFELTDARIVVWFPTQNNEAKYASGEVRFNAGDTDEIRFSIEPKTIAANSNVLIAYASFEQNDGMCVKTSEAFGNSGNLANQRIKLQYDKTDKYYPYVLGTYIIRKISFVNVTGTMDYRIYGKRKWWT
jgi:hypothetical protein